MKKTFLSFAVVALIFAGRLHATGSVDLGKQAFSMHCARCHGADAKGNGPDAKRMTVAPRDITSGKFKFKSTVQGTPPSDDDLTHGILGHGMAGAGMPSFANLEKETLADIVAYIKSISPAFQTTVKPEPIPLPANYRAKSDLAKGKEIYTKLQCALCHGDAGRANGTSAFTLVDGWGKPIRPANLQQGWTYRAGAKPLDVYHRILAGIEGAPMPSYEGAATHEEIWELCNYVASLQLETNWAGEIVAAKVSGNLPVTADDAAWKQAVRTDINMQEYVYASGHKEHLTVNAVSVQALYNDDSVSFRIFWDDPIKNDKGTPDALLVAIKPKDFSADVRANLHTLYASNQPLDLVYWSAGDENAVYRKADLPNAYSRSGGKTLPTIASYDDGRWTLVVTRKFDLDSTDPIEPGSTRMIGFTAADGNNKESGQKRSVSQWVRLVLGESHHE